MFLSHRDIIRELEDNGLSFDPPISPDRVRQISIDLRIGRRFTTFKEGAGYVNSIQMDPSLWDSKDLWETREAESFRLESGSFVLAQTLEQICMPGHLMGLVEGRSGYARIGIAVHLTAPKIDPGFRGHITLEMTNFGKMPVTLRAEKDTPVQLLLANITTPLSGTDLYGAQSTDLFQGQENPIPTRTRN